MRLACIGYRDWANRIYKRLQSEFSEYEFLMQLSKDDFCQKQIEEFQPDLIFFYGWSDIIKSDLIERYKCLMLHPSRLPQYRGGSPIQNQIINGEIDSAVTIFLMDAGIDTGPIAKQEYLSLEGGIEEIFERIENVGFELTRNILIHGLELTAQDEKNATYCTRRAPHQSEITIDEIVSQTSTYLYNKVRMLQGPYPNAFIRTMDGKKLIIKEVEILDDTTLQEAKKNRMNKFEDC